jgi:chitodextrinase
MKATRWKAGTGCLGILLVIALMIAGCGGGGGGGDDAVVVDTTPPPVPTGLTATAVSASEIDLAWVASTDAVGYKIYRNGVFYFDRFGGTTFNDTNLTAKTTYTYTVSAYDSAGNESAQSAAASATTLDTATVLLGTPANDYGRGVTLDSSGNVYVAGWSAGALDGLANPNGADVFVAKYNSAGVKQWTRLLGTTGVVDPDAGVDMGNYGLNVAVDSTGGYVYVTGYTTAAMDGQLSHGGRDIFLVRYDLNGGSKQTRLLGTAQADAGNAVAVDVNGNVYIACYTEGTLGSPNSGGKDIVVAKFNSSLVLQDAWQIGSAGDDVATGVAVSAAGDSVYITGLAGGVLPSLVAGNTYAGNGDLMVARFSNAGVLGWTALLGSPETDAGLAVAVIGSAVNVAGVTGGALPGKTSQGGNDIVVASYNATNGTVYWTEQLGTSEDDAAYGITTDSVPGNVFVTGFTSGNLSPFKPNAGLEDVFLIKFGFGGGTPFAISLAGSNEGDEGRAIAIRESDNTAYVVGFTGGNLDGVQNSGGYDMCLLKFDLAGQQQ